MNFTNILVATIADAAPMLTLILAVYLTGKLLLYVATTPSTDSYYTVKIGGHKKRLSALE